MKKIRNYILFFLLLIVSSIFFLPNYLDCPPSLHAKDDKVEFNVEEGETLRHVIKRLKALDLIKSETYALLCAKWKKYNIKTGIYDFSHSFRTTEILNLLTKGGREELIKVTIPEGLTIKKTALVLEEKGVCKALDFIQSAKNISILNEFNIASKTAEGFLFPDTYLLSKKDNAQSIVRMMIKNFFLKAKKINNFPKDKNEIYKIVTLASIVEREYQVDEEASIISGVFTNRLNIKMPLQSCATVEYIITEIEGKPHPKRLFFEDIERKNEYNTYVHQGLPPTPIANPGFVSLSAACNPKKTNYLYFRLIDAKEGRHAFSTNVRDHNKIGNTYLLKK